MVEEPRRLFESRRRGMILEEVTGREAKDAGAAGKRLGSRVSGMFSRFIVLPESRACQRGEWNPPGFLRGGKPSTVAYPHCVRGPGP